MILTCLSKRNEPKRQYYSAHIYTIFEPIKNLFGSHKRDYYKALKEAQSSNNLPDWVHYFVKAIVDAQEEAEALIFFTVKKAKFFDRFKDVLNERQTRVITRMLKEGPTGFDGSMSAKKYIAIAKITKATATRDLQDLLEKNALTVSGAGRSTRYQVNLI